METRAERRLTGGPGKEAEPRWSPDDAWIAFVSNRTGDAENNRRSDVWPVSPNPDSPRNRRLTFGDVGEHAPRWSPPIRLDTDTLAAPMGDRGQVGLVRLGLDGVAERFTRMGPTASAPSGHPPPRAARSSPASPALTPAGLSSGWADRPYG